VAWIRQNVTATADDFLAWLKRRYERPDLADRFPGGLP
jgi:hypothetical protein